MEFNDHEELVKIKFHKINDLIPFANQYDCEMTPDYIDGGHGIQVSINSLIWCKVWIQRQKLTVEFIKFHFRIRDYFPTTTSSLFYLTGAVNLSPNSNHAMENHNGEFI